LVTLLVSSFTPGVSSGRGLRTYGIVRAMAASALVDVLYVRFGQDTPDRTYQELDGVRLHEVVSSRGLRRAVAYANARRLGAPPAVARGVSPDLARTAAELARGCERVIADDLTAAVALTSLARRRPVIYSAHNLESSFRCSGGDADWGSRRTLEAFERRILRTAAEAWMPSRPDLEQAAALAPSARLRLVPNVVDVPTTGAVNAPLSTNVALMVGDFRYGPNREGLEWLLREVLPAVWNRAPQVRLVVVGRGLEPPPAADPRVAFRGYVRDLAAEYRSAAVAVVPLLTGGGTPLKFLEALSHGVPVVATPRAAAGLELTPDAHYLLGDGAEGFAVAMLAGLDQPKARPMAAAGRAVVERKYSIASLAEALAA
jgi:glycosyltransferase involved in cell wall biosynthesis